MDEVPTIQPLTWGLRSLGSHICHPGQYGTVPWCPRVYIRWCGSVGWTTAGLEACAAGRAKSKRRCLLGTHGKGAEDDIAC